MYIFKDEAKKLLNDSSDSMISELRQKSDFMLALIEDDDWSMIIKSHALVESLITELLVSKTEEPKLKSLIERLPLSDDQIGKIKIAKDYELLSTSERSFIKRLSELRNSLVHKFENIDFNLINYVNSLDKNQKKSWQKTFTWYEHGRSVENSWVENTLSKPKISVWMSIYMFVSLTVVKISELKNQTQIDDASQRTINELLKEKA